MSENSKKDDPNIDQKVINECDSNKNVDYDQLLFSAGEFGLYQVYLFFLSGPFYICGAFSYFSQLFLTEASSDHWCWIPELENLTALERKQLAIPVDVNSRFEHSRCSSYAANWSEVLIYSQKANRSWPIQSCQNGWEFNNTEIPYATITSDLGWVCEQDTHQATAQSVFFVGSILGGLIIGWIADRFGRLPAAMASNLIGCLAGIGSAFTKGFTTFTLCRFLMGMSYDNCMMMTYLLVLEYVAPKYRTIMANLAFSIFFTAGVCILPWIALLCGDWKITSIVTSCLFGLTLFSPLVLPESPRWLLARGRTDDAVNQVMSIGKINKKTVSRKLIEEFKLSISKCSENKEKSTMIDMMKRPLLRRVFICMSLVYFCCYVVYDSLIRTISDLKFNFFVSFTIVSFTEFPSILLLSFVLDFIGRKKLTILAMFLCGIFSFILPFVGHGWPSVMCAVVARFVVNMSLSTCMQWSAEILPAPIRGSGTSIIHICGYVATVISPFIPHLAVFRLWFPMFVVGCTSILTAVLCFALPETAKVEMPQTFDDAEILIRNQSMWKMKKNVRELTGQVHTSFELN
ncbi:carcinine transporter-like [Bombyx mandarina]|uniref:Carcinine transporter-like n=1 Tax=Bombyx mandarina TaxID=7092 RepID=A0A6J2JWV3_BOMMA|nr:carcinine transporter-like [Bombyx mandarina]